jgi:hypothetical protein
MTTSGRGNPSLANDSPNMHSGWNRPLNEMFEVVVSRRFAPKYKREFAVSLFSITRVEAGSNTSTVTLRLVGGDEKGSLESETVNYGHESRGSRTRKCLHWQGPGAIVNDRPVLSSETAPHINKPATV